MGGMTEWEKLLRRRAAAVKRDEDARKGDMAAARLAGHSFREIGRWADVNHETARKACIEINGHSRTQAELDAVGADA